MSRLVLLGLALVLVAAGPVPSSPPDATTARRGLINTAAQSFAGLKTFDGGVVADLKTGSTAFGFEIQTATTAAMTLYVDPIGSDSNACTSSGASACRTWAGVAGKIPSRVRHNVVVNIAAGTYAEVLAVTGFTLGRNPATSTTPSFQITGTLAAPTLSTGTSAGSVTGYSAAAGATLAVLTDSTQNWTTNQLRGALLLMGSGSASGTYFPIVSNTATTITLAADGAIAAGNTYVITAPASIFTSTAVYTGDVGAGTLTTSNIRFQPSSGTALQVSQNNLSFAWNRCAFVGGNTSLLTSEGNLRTLTFTNAYMTSSLSTATCMFTMSNGGLTINSSYLRASASAAIPLCISQGMRVTNISAHIEGFPTSEGLFEIFNGNHSGSQTSVTLHCLTPGTGTGLFAPHPGQTSQGAVGTWGAVLLAVKDCATGVYIASALELSATGVYFDGTTTGISIDGGGVFSFRYSAPTFTGVTNELYLDGSPYTYAFFNSLSPALMTGYSGARFMQQ